MLERRVLVGSPKPEGLRGLFSLGVIIQGQSCRQPGIWGPGQREGIWETVSFCMAHVLRRRSKLRTPALGFLKGVACVRARVRVCSIHQYQCLPELGKLHSWFCERRRVNKASWNIGPYFVLKYRVMLIVLRTGFSSSKLKVFFFFLLDSMKYC